MKENWVCSPENSLLSAVHTNPFSNENGTVLLRFQKDLRPRLSFWYRFRPSSLQRQSREKPHGSVCPPFWILTAEWSIWRPVVCFSGNTRKQRFQKASHHIVLKSLHSGERFRMAPFSVIVFAGNGLELEKIGQFFSSFDVTCSKHPQEILYYG